MTKAGGEPIDRTRARVRAAALDGLFGVLFTLAITAVLLAFIALYYSGSAGVISCLVAACVGFGASVVWSWKTRGGTHDGASGS